MDCPRCRLTLSSSAYEDEPVNFCGNCWGYWVEQPRLERIVSGVEYRFSRAEADPALQAMRSSVDADRQGAEDQPIPCPACGTLMERKQYSTNCPVMIDECAAHGVWLDTGEIKDLQLFVEQHL